MSQDVMDGFLLSLTLHAICTDAKKTYNIFCLVSMSIFSTLALDCVSCLSNY